MYIDIVNLLNAHSVINIYFHLQAIETLKSFEKKDSKVASTAATNLSFLYFLVSQELASAMLLLFADLFGRKEGT